MSGARAANRFEGELLATLQHLPALKGQRLIVAASGGADSTALLAAMHELARSGRYPCELLACHIDHGLRPVAERAAEQALLAKNCATLSVPLTVQRVQVERRRGGSLEAAAREARYAALGAVAAEEGVGAVLTAHTAGDQAETVLLRLLRGTGVAGLSGIAAQSRPWGDSGPLLLRPLLAAWPQEARRYCLQRGVAWSEDETNASPRFVRNRVRHELLPSLNAFHASAGRSLARLAGQAAELRSWIDGEVERVLDACLVWDGDSLLLRAPPAELASFLGKQVAARVLRELLGGAGAPGARQVEALFACWNGPLGRRCDLGHGWRAEATSAGLRIHHSDSCGQPSVIAPRDTANAGDRWLLRLGPTEIPGWRVNVAPAAVADLFYTEHAEPELCAYLPDGAIEELSVRFWRPGDRMRPAGLRGSKKLQDIFVDEKVDRTRRHSVPLLLLGGECIWAVGVKRSALALSTPPPGAALHVRFLPQGRP